MDRKSIVILLISVGVLMMWGPLVNKIFPPTVVSIGLTNTVSTTAGNVSSAASTPQAPPTPVTPVTPVLRSASSPVVLSPDSPEKTESFKAGDAVYTFTSHGGGLKTTELLNYPQTIPCGKKTASAGNATLNQQAYAPIFALGGGAQGDGLFKLSKIDGGIRAEKTLTNGFHLIKEFYPSTNYLVQVKVTVQNPTAETNRWPASELILGTASALTVKEEALYIGALWYDGEKLSSVTGSWFDNRFLGCFPGTPRSLYREGLNNVRWAAVHDQFFATALMMPTNLPAPELMVRPVKMKGLPGNAVPTKKTEALLTGYEASVAYPEVVIEPNHQYAREFTLYAGPKEYNLLAKHALKFNNDIDEVMNFGKYIGIVSKLLLLLMNKLNSFGLGYGLAIVVMTIIIKLLFWPLTNASTKSMKRMAMLQPQMKIISDKYKDDAAKKNQKMMEFMKENKVNPIGGCLPLLLQMPIFFGLIGMLRSSIELRGAKFLWACDLSQPDTVLEIAGFALNPMWFVMLGTMVWQMRLTPMSPGMDPAQQKIMKWMPVAFMVFFYNFSAGLTLYWAVQNLLSILQTKLTKTADTPPPGAALATVTPTRVKK